MQLPSEKTEAQLGHARVELYHARTFFERFRGLMLQPTLADNRAVYFSRCNSIHTCFMRFAIDVAFLDDENRIVGIHKAVAPWRLITPRRGYRNAIEFRAGEFDRLNIRLGDALRLGGAP